MMLWVKMAARNLLRNGRRSLFTIIAIGFGYAGVTLFGGFVHYIFTSLREMQIYGRAGGHLTLLKAGWDRADATEDETAFSAEELATIERVLGSEPAVAAVSPAVIISGILSNGKSSSICYGAGIVPSTVARIRDRARGVLGEFRYYEGEALADDRPSGIGVSRSLVRMLDLKLGDTVVLAGPTMGGQLNAVDCEVAQIFETTGDQAERAVVVPLEHARSLRDAGGAHRVGVLLREGAPLAEATGRLRRAFAEAGCAVSVRTWEEMSDFYRRVRDMFKVINRFNLVIVLVVAVMSVINTVSMAVMERTREIGTLRALGLKPRGVRMLFALESAIIGLCGTAMGLALQVAGWLAVRLAQPTWIPPQINVEVPLYVHLVASQMLVCALGVAALSVLAALSASRRAAVMEVVDALRHN